MILKLLLNRFCQCQLFTFCIKDFLLQHFLNSHLLNQPGLSNANEATIRILFMVNYKEKDFVDMLKISEKDAFYET